MQYKNFVKDGSLTVFFDISIFSKEAVLKALYWYGDKFHCSIETTADTKFIQVTLKPMVAINMTDDELTQYLQKVERDALDYQLRQIVQAETQNIRDLLVAKAFSYGEYDEEPRGEITDPIGFDTESIK